MMGITPCGEGRLDAAFGTSGQRCGTKIARIEGCRLLSPDGGGNGLKGGVGPPRVSLG
jgi:hypothetical protein